MAQGVTWRRPTARQVAEAIRWYYGRPGNGAGGSLHVVVDDGNWERDFVVGAYKHALEEGDMPGAMLAMLLLSLSNTQRIKAIAMWRGLPRPAQQAQEEDP